jgi:hypothetical protein
VSFYRVNDTIYNAWLTGDLPTRRLRWGLLRKDHRLAV